MKSKNKYTKKRFYLVFSSHHNYKVTNNKITLVKIIRINYSWLSRSRRSSSVTIIEVPGHRSLLSYILHMFCLVSIPRNIVLSGMCIIEPKQLYITQGKCRAMIGQLACMNLRQTTPSKYLVNWNKNIEIWYSIPISTYLGHHWNQ